MTDKKQTPLHESNLKAMLIAGVGNIGSGLAPMLARMGVAKLLLVDPDVYETRNLACQDILACDVGKPKAVVQARRLRRINPAIDARAFCSRIEDLPLGVMRVDAIASCLDSRQSRRYVNQAAWRLGVPWIDGAVDASSLLARVNVYVPGSDSTCMECGWDDEDYDIAALEQRYPCEKGVGGPAPTRAPASLGLVTAALMAVESQKVLTDDHEHLLSGRQMMLDLRHHTHHLTTFQRRHCRFDHEIWQLEELDNLPTKLTLGEVVQLAANGSHELTNCSLRIEGQHFAVMLCCPGCGHHETIPLCLAGRIPSARRRCAACGQTMTVRGFDLREWVDSQALSDEELARPLSSLGVEPCDVLSVRGKIGERHFMLNASTVSPITGRRKGERQRLAANIARR